MKPNFALSLSFDGLRLMHRVPQGWALVGQVALDTDDLTGALAGLRDAAASLEPSGITTKLLIPNDQIKYLALDTTRAEDDDVRQALDGATPYAVDELAYDFAKGGGRTYVAAVAKETLAEAQQFATEHGFNPISFAAVPEPFTYVGEAFFGPVDGKTAERDAEPVIVTGTADVPVQPTVGDETTPIDPEPTPIESQAEPDTVLPDVDEMPEPVVEAPAEIEQATDVADFAPEDIDVPDTPAEGEDATQSEEIEATATEAEIEQAAIVDAPDVEADAPVFSSRLRADRTEGAPAPADQAVDDPVFTARREPTFAPRATPPSDDPAPLAVPTGQGTDAMPPVAAPTRDADAAPAAPIVTTQVQAPDAAPAVTGEAASALAGDAPVVAPTIAVDPDPEPDTTQDTSVAKSAAATAMGAATAVGGMFASRRMARAEAKENAAAQPDAAPDEKSRLTVFGARKRPAPKPVVGGKPRFLGLILTAILLLFLLAIAAFAALSEDGIAGWFGWGSSDTQIASDAAPTDIAAPEVAAVQPSETVSMVEAPDVLAAPTAPAGGLVLTPEEAQRIYAATGVWQKAPRIPLTPRTTTLDAMTLGQAPLSVPRVPPSPLASASSVAGDAVIATPVDPPAPDATFDFNANGLVVATPQGAVTPDGILVIAGTPPLNPPTRPGTVAPEVTPQDQIAAVVPETAQPVPDAPEGVIVIAGRPSIEPPVRTGTVAPQAAPVTGNALVSTDGLVVLAGSPPVLPPARPGTVATPVAVAPEAVLPVTPNPVTPDVPPAAGVEPEGVNLIAGPPPVLPPARPGTLAPQNDAGLTDLTTDIAAALATTAAQTPDANVLRPVVRPAAVIQAAAAAANAPVLGALTASEASSFRPRTRPAGLAPAPAPEPEPAPVAPQEAAVQTPTLEIAPEIAAAVQAAANRPNPIVNATAQAVTRSERPDTRPRNMARIVARATAANERAAAQVASVAPRTVAPSGPTGSAVAQNATLENAMNLRDINLIGIYGGSNDRRALVRLGNGRYVRLTVGDRLDGGRVTAISSGALSYTKRGRAITLEVAG